MVLDRKGCIPGIRHQVRLQDNGSAKAGEYRPMQGTGFDCDSASVIKQQLAEFQDFVLV